MQKNKKTGKSPGFLHKKTVFETTFRERPRVKCILKRLDPIVMESKERKKSEIFSELAL